MNTVILVRWNINVRSKLIVRKERGGDGLNHKKGSWLMAYFYFIFAKRKKRKIEQNNTKKNPQKAKLVPMPKQINLPF